MSSPNHLSGKDWKKYQQFSQLVEQKIKSSPNIYHARAVLWVKKITDEYLGGAA